MRDKLNRWTYRVPAFLGGAAILYHEVSVVETSEPLLVVVALYLLGVPIVDLLQQVRGEPSTREGR
jgi:hypothetical protein